MAAGEPQIFNNITPAQFATLSERAKGAGIDMSGNSGSAEKFGVEVAWIYDPEAQQLTLQCLKAPFFLSTADVDGRIRSLVNQAVSGSPNPAS